MSQQIFDDRLVKLHLDKLPNKYPAFLQEQAAADILSRLDDMSRPFEDILEIGDTALASSLKNRPGTKNSVQIGLFDDIEGQYDLIISAINLSWINELPQKLVQIKNSLKKDGVFIANMWGGRTLNQLRRVLIEAEGGLAPRISPFVDIKTIGMLIQKAGFDAPIADGGSFDVAYDGFIDLAHDLRGSGQQNALLSREKPLNKALLQKISDIYKSDFSDNDNGIIATFEIITITGLATSG